jgi:radical SAM superfamily enzyme YgiQ (UPF0313 family)
MVRVSGMNKSKPLDVCLVFTPAYELQEDRLEPPLGLLYLATVAKEAGYNVAIADMAGVPEHDWELPFANYYGFSTYSTTYQRTLKLRNLALKTNPAAKTIAGGPHASALPNHVVCNFNHVVVGEGEHALLDIMSGMNPLPLIHGRPAQKLDELPFVDYSLVDIDSYRRIVDGKPSRTLLSSRGCPYSCLFCNSVVMGAHKPIRFRSPQNVVEEMALILKENPDVAFRFGDDLFGANSFWLESFVKLVKPLDVTYRAFVRVNQCCRPGFTDMLAESGCKHIAIGMESGSDIILGAMSKGQTTAQIRTALAAAKASGLIVRVYVIVGFPGETWDTVNETVSLIEQTQPDEFVIYPLIPYPGTPLFDNPEAYGLFNINKDFTHYFQIHGDGQSEFVYDLKDYDRDELQEMKEYVIAECERLQLAWARDSKGYV